jgi:hypothetical protein
MRDLIDEGLTRLAGTSSQAIFHLKQAMGGGKTHLLVGFGLLARHQELLAYYFLDLARSGHKDILNNGFKLNPIFGSAVFDTFF